MKRKLFYFAVSALALSACTSEGVVEDAVQNRNVIGFENVVTKPSRATDLTGATLNHFNVFGYYTADGSTTAHQVFDDVDVTLAEGATVWSYITATTPARYWVPGATYRFFGYSCGNAALAAANGALSFAYNDATEANRVLSISNYICDATNQADLIYAASGDIEAKKDNNNLVQFKFDHLLSKVSTQFTSTLPEEYTVEISDVKIEGFRNKGDYSPLTDWANQTATAATAIALPFEGVNTVNAEDEAATATEAVYVLPCKYDKDATATEAEPNAVKLTFSVVLKNNGEEVYTTNCTGTFNPEWKTGYSYIYNVELSGDALNLEVIAFGVEVDVNGFTSETEGTIELDKEEVEND